MEWWQRKVVGSIRAAPGVRLSASLMGLDKNPLSQEECKWHELGGWHLGY